MPEVKNKIFILKSQKDHFWFSCNIIESHIEQALKKSGFNIEYLYCDKSLSDEQIKLISNSEEKTYLYFLSDILLFQDIVKQVDHLNDLNFIIPIYGNLTVEPVRWRDLNGLLKGKKVALLASSPRSKQQIETLIEGTTVAIVPFPIELPNKSLARKIKDDEIIRLIYAGRITPQKNILQLIRTFNESLKYKPNQELYIAGNFHKRPYHLHGYIHDTDRYEQDFLQLVKDSKGKVTFHSFLDQDQLINLYLKMDYFISTSTYHDEDFGVSAVQAKLSGLEMLLSDWGGHSNITEKENLIATYIDGKENLSRVESKNLLKHLIKTKKNNNTHVVKGPNKFDYDSFNSNFKELLSKDFEKFISVTDTYKEHINLLLQRQYPFSKLRDGAKELYKKIYINYLEDKKAEGSRPML